MDHMAHLLAARMHGELDNVVAAPVWDRDLLDEVIEAVLPVRIPKARQKSGEDTERWLRVNMPALGGPHAGRPRIKHVLRDTSRITKIGARNIYQGFHLLIPHTA